MKDSLNILNTRDIKKITEELKKQYDIKELKFNYVFLKNNKNRIFITNKDISKIDFSKIRVNGIGLYFANQDKLGLRLTIEGTQLIGDKANKNVLELSQEDLENWFTGKDIETNEKLEGFIILKHKKDFLGTGNYSNGKIYNYISKERYVKFKNDEISNR